ncbi:SagB family peptide dehydrogenase [Streptomyces sp. NPDC020965]|uniref:SagB family peptide dehydrogenase n=1 Tax=Streptomyces sp. NPDC020965 TaxID=3365105 RepID=UPI0037A4BB4B
MSEWLRISPTPEVTLTSGPDLAGTVTIHSPASDPVVISDLDHGVAAALTELSRTPLTIRDMTELAAKEGPASDPSVLAVTITRLLRAGLVRLQSVVGQREIAEGVLISARGECAPVTLGGEQTVRLSRFAHLMRKGEEMVVESPTAFARVTLADPALAAVIGFLGRARTVADLCAMSSCTAADTEAFLHLLVALGLAGATDDSGLLAEERDPDLVPREFHDVLLHQLSRDGLADRATGGVFPFLGAQAPLPALKTMPGELIPLPRPDLDALVATDPSLARTMETRRSIRTMGEKPLTREQLGELLFRVARVKEIIPPGTDAEGRPPYESSRRPYPSGGASYDLEFYLTVRKCVGIAPGLYHYDPVYHGLRLVTANARRYIALIDDAHGSTARHTVPHVVLTLASRFNRLAWKYRGISYATTLKNVGVVYQSVYLAATAMGIAVCGAGGGNSARFAAATGIDPMVESSVGEMIIGSLPEDSS